jgi:hypothetical protein
VAFLGLKLGSERFPVEDLLHHQEIFQRSDVDVIFYRNARPLAWISSVELRRSHGILSTRAMPQTILLVSRDEALQNTRALILEGAGYRTITTGSLISAVQLSSHRQMSIIGHTLSPEEQDDFIDRVHEEIQAYISYVSLWTNAAWSALDPVVKCFAPHPGGSRVCIMEESNLIAWPKRAS